VDRLKKTTVDIVTQNQQTVLCVVLTYSGQTVEDNSGHSDTESKDGTLCSTADIGKAVEDSCGHSDTDPNDGALCGTADIGQTLEESS
jgi:hypothetical protein